METYLWCAVGIIISVVLPIVWEVVYRYFPKPTPSAEPAAARAALGAFWRTVKPYVLLGIASLLTAILVVAFLGDTLKDYRAALLAGYAWDSTLQKLRR
ncbi:MAG: hypothetical protein ISS72_01230 [Candidatus Brocadiae bacterium]|nr:hypothetical protein [Candidatus Brocadiia bacterium]